MKCPNCQAENADDSAACAECGARLDVPIPPSDEERARRLVEEAFRLSDEGKLAQAITTCRRAVTANPTSTSAHSLLGILYERAGQRELAIQAYEAALRLSPESAADREALQQLISRPAQVEAPPVTPPPVLPVAVSAPAPMPRRRPRRSPWPAAISWSLTAVLAVALIVLGVALYTVSGSRQDRAGLGRRAVGPPSGERVAARPNVAPVTGVMQLPQPGAPIAAPALPARAPEEPPQSAPVAEVTPVAGEPAESETTVSIPIPDSFAAPASTGEPETAAAASQAAPTVQSARSRFFAGDLQGAVGDYEAVIAARTQVTAEIYQDVGWLYYQAGRKADATAAYRESLARYQAQIASGTDTEAARHGVRTTEAALRVLELE